MSLFPLMILRLYTTGRNLARTSHVDERMNQTVQENIIISDAYSTHMVDNKRNQKMEPRNVYTRLEYSNPSD